MHKFPLKFLIYELIYAPVIIIVMRGALITLLYLRTRVGLKEHTRLGPTDLALYSCSLLQHLCLYEPRAKTKDTVLCEIFSSVISIALFIFKSVSINKSFNIYREIFLMSFPFRFILN